MQPDTHYAKSGEVRIAYQVFGQGAFDLVYVPGFVSNIDLYWDYRPWRISSRASGRSAA